MHIESDEYVDLLKTADDCLNVGNETEALRLYILALGRGSNEAALKLGIIYEDKGQFFKAIESYRIAAEKGHTEAQYMLGSLYIDMSENYDDEYINKAYMWLEKSVLSGDLMSIETITMLLRYRYDLFKNVKVVHEINKLALKNYKSANYAMGLIYLKGGLVHRNLFKSIKYFIRGMKCGK